MESVTHSQEHPGTFVRKSVIPSGMTVTEAAKRLGVGRPALSNFLNGRSGLSAEMAVRLEKAFGAYRQQLLDMQAAYERQERNNSEKAVAVRAFVPSFLTIRARQIESWAEERIDARTHLPVLVRKLVQSTGNELRKVDFPGYDNAERKGDDGFVEAASATPWIPEGASLWEFGTSSNPQSKAQKDYAARLKSVDSEERSRSTFIFVTPRNWPNKAAWEKEKNAAGDWKQVRAFDASDLEQWLEQSVAAQVWFAEQIGIPRKGLKTLEQAWNRWANASEPNLTSEIFAPAIAAYKTTFKDWISREAEKQFFISADSHEEALGFLACVLEADDLRQFKDLTAVFTSAETLRMLIDSSVRFIPIVVSEEVERELGDAHRRLHCIVFRPRNSVDIEADIVLDLLTPECFERALTGSGIPQEDVPRLARESGRSPTVLRRRLSKNPAIRTPVWAGDNETATGLMPIALIGAWNVDKGGDREILAYVADKRFEEIEAGVMSLLGLEDCPVWAAGSHRGVVSKIDAMFAIARVNTREQVDRFFFAAEMVLSETDPALELPEDDRWAAALYGKTRDHSNALREGVCETLVIISVYGNSLLQGRTGIDIEQKVSVLIGKLLTPLSLDKLLSQDHNLPFHAEAAPDEFLRIVEADLAKEEPVLFELLKPVDNSSVFATPLRSGLLWALECIAWSPKYLPRVCKILARLCERRIDDNWTNKPGTSLHAVFRAWMPQTAATVDERIEVLKTINERVPDVGWGICIEQIDPRPRFSHDSYRPRWRSDASGAGQAVTYGEAWAFAGAALGMLVAWPKHDETTLGQLVEYLEGIPEEDQTKCWDLIDDWSRVASDDAKARLRERIRRFALTPRGRGKKVGESSSGRAHKAYDSLEPTNSVMRHRWLFLSHWVQESAGEIQEEDFDWQEREERIDRLRREGMYEIWTKYGLEGAKELMVASSQPQFVGRYAISCIDGIEGQEQFIRNCLELDGELREKGEWCLQGALSALDDELRTKLLHAAAEGMPAEEQKRLFVCAPFQECTWRLLDCYEENIRTGYWQKVYPDWRKHTASELAELIDRLLEVGRPRGAFNAVHLSLADIETSRLKRLLRALGTVFDEPPNHFRMDQYHISKGFESLQSRNGVTREEKAELEFLFIEALADSEYGIPNLEYMIGESPVLFVQAVALAYKRSDEKTDPAEWLIKDTEQRASMAWAARRVLDEMKRLPGTDKGGGINAVLLSNWIDEVRRLCLEHARMEIGDFCLGQMLSKSLQDEDGSWPCVAVCEVMEELASWDIGRGFQNGVFNARGAHWRGEGGQQERELATGYRTMAEKLRFKFPYVGGVLEEIAVSYERQGSWHDSESKVAKRLPS